MKFVHIVLWGLFLAQMTGNGINAVWGQAPRGLLLRQAQVVDVKAGKVLANRQVWIVDDTIRAVAPADSLLPPAQDTFQLGGRYLMPGLTDSHVHYFQSGGLYTRPDVIDLRFLHDYQQELGWLSTHVSDLWTRYLAAGITTTIDLGGPLNNYRLRDQADSAALAPNLWVTGPLLSSYLPQELDSSDPPILKIDSPTAGRAAVQAQLPYQPDFIKIWYIVLPGQSVETFRPVAAAIIDEAHRHHLPVAVHATELATARAAVESGADLLVHSVDDQLVDSAFVALLLDRGVAYCPTLTVSESYEEVLANHLDVKPVDWALAHPATLGSLSDLARVADDQLPPWAQALRAQPYQAPAKLPIMYANLRRLAQAGVPILTGTDAGNIGTLHASSYFEELAAMESAGMSPAALLRASTYEAAQFFGKRTGLVAPGYAADLLLLDQNPLEDWHHWYPATAVVRKGTFYHPDELIPRTTETVVLDFLNAWRWGDIPRLRSLMHPSVIHYRNGQQFAGATGVGLIWTSKTVPPGSPRLIDQGKQIRVEWGELSWVFVVVKGSIRKIYGP